MERNNSMNINQINKKEKEKKIISDSTNQINSKKEMKENNYRHYKNTSLKNYEKFKNITIDNKQSMYKLKKILLFRTHSKKLKKRGRKKKYNKIEDDIIEKKKNQSRHAILRL